MEPLRAEAIATARLDLVPLLVEHADEMATVLADSALHRFIGGAPADREALRTRYRRLVAGPADPAVSWLNWVIRWRAAARLTGTVQATVSPSATGPIAEVAWVVGTPWQQRGIASEAAHGLVAWLCTQPVTEIVAHIDPQHHASGGVATAAGLTPTDEWQDGELRWRRPTAEL